MSYTIKNLREVFEAGPDGLELLVFGPHHEGDTEVLRGDFWGDGT